MPQPNDERTLDVASSDIRRSNDAKRNETAATTSEITLPHRPHEQGDGNLLNPATQDLTRRSLDDLSEADSRHRSKSKGRKPSTQTRICGTCQRQLMGQFLRALGGTYHLDCFRCHDCDKIVASKFFPVPDQPPNQYPLCETDYFRRLDLLCHACGGALRGSYITALERKYHIEHFTCSVCPTIFGAQDSYYEHEGSVYCHYHYSTKFAQRCNGCQTAILKQFVEIFRNGVNQYWHPECYMIHKYWNVRLHSAPTKGSLADEQETEQRKRLTEGPNSDASEAERKTIREEEDAVEYKVHWIWQTLSSFEERSATCISDMLLHVSNGAYMDGVVAARRFITHIDVLFGAADELNRRLLAGPGPDNGERARNPDRSAPVPRGLSYSREAKVLCKKVVAFFQLLADNQDNGVRRLGVTQELLFLVNGLAHYLKLMMRICLSGALKLEREMSSVTGLEGFLKNISKLDDQLDAESKQDSRHDPELYVSKSADTCMVCNKSVEDKCYRLDKRVLHTECLVCSKCNKDLSANPSTARWSEQSKKIFCETHAGPDAHITGFVAVTRLQQYVHLLRVAHARLLATLRTSGALPHTTDDPNLGDYDSRDLEAVENDSLVALGRSNTRSRSYAGRPGGERSQDEASYEDTMGNIRRLRSIRMEKQLSNATRKARTSRIIDGPEAVRPGSADGTEGPKRRKTGTFQIVEDRDANGETVTQLTFGAQDTMTLDDIPRIVQAQQTKEQRPNASRYARNPMIPQEPKMRLVNGHTRDLSNDAGKMLNNPLPATKKYFSELTALEYFIVRHLAVLSMESLLTGHFDQEELIDLIEAKRPTFWSKFGKAFQGKEKKPKGSKNTSVFGVPLEQLLERDYEESTDGVGPGLLKIPSLVQEAISAMKTMDMSVEGVFRKNGNIKRLNEAKEDIDSKGTVEVDLTRENPVQVAALLKKFLREMPDPLLTHKLHKLWITSQRIDDNEKRRRILHLTCCLLPKAHRDTLEVLFNFLNWVSSFSHVDEESGSKMDVHNLATVIAPNIIHRGKDHMPVDESFLAIEAVHSLIEWNESMCEVPEDLALMMNDSSLFNNTPDITTKEILKRYNDYVRDPRSRPGNTNSSLDNPANGTSSPTPAAGVKRVDTDPSVQNAWQNESSVRHVGSSNDLHNPPNLPYLNPSKNGSVDSHGASPNRASIRGGPFDKPRAVGIA